MRKFFKTALLCTLAVAMVACEKEPVGGNEGGDVTPLSFDIEVSNIKATTAQLSITPSDNTVRYYFDIMPEADYVELNGDVAAFFTAMLGYYTTLYPSLDISAFLQQLLSVGPASDAVVNLTPGQSYYAYAVEVDVRSGKTGAYSVKKFTTVESGDPAACSFDITIRKTYATEVEFSIVPSDETVGYWYAVTPVDSYPGDVVMQSQVEQELKNYAEANGMSIEEVAAGVVVRGRADDLWFELNNSTSYYVYAYAMGATGEAVGPLYKEQFTTAKYDISTAEVQVGYRIFDGAALYEQNNSLDEGVKDMAVVQYEVTPNTTSAYWLVRLGMGDMTDTDKYPDESTLNALLSGSVSFNQLVSHYYVPWNEVATLMWFAADVDMIYGPLKRQLITVTKENCSPISEYREAQKADLPYYAPVTSTSAAKSLVERKISSTKVGRRVAL